MYIDIDGNQINNLYSIAPTARTKPKHDIICTDFTIT